MARTVTELHQEVRETGPRLPPTFARPEASEDVVFHYKKKKKKHSTL